MRLIIFGLALAVGALAQTAVVRTAAGDPTITSVIANAGTTGTTVSRLAKVNTSGQAIITATTDTSGAVGVVIGGAGTTGSATIATVGAATCEADNTMTTGDFVVLGSTTAGRCRSAGTSCPASGQVIGQARTSAAAAATFTVQLRAGLCPGSGTGVAEILTANSGSWWPFGEPSGDSTGHTFGDNTTYFWEFVLPVKITIAKMMGYQGANGAGQNMTFGIYNSAGTLLQQTDTLDVSTGANTVRTFTFATPPALNPGIYFMAASASGTAAVSWLGIGGTIFYFIMNGQATPRVFTGTASTGTTTITLPGTTGAKSAFSKHPPALLMVP